ncbi:DUF1294 domain-containing protein [Bacillus sp. FJAT-45350]|uniref:DUF1294 domain-containing protein n=1 Tax=Bacillus sp. FJAT-45350 TaxID=2011014 RepID=UPI000BB6FC74|nr:DUF1294 domain-containing protein [Bacillus sp. FJAT-45350]
MLLIYFIVVNALAFSLMGIDKRRARKNEWRIAEKTLMYVALIGGSIGIFLGMKQFRHKTKRRLFKIGVPLIIWAQLIVLFLYFSNILSLIMS